MSSSRFLMVKAGTLALLAFLMTTAVVAPAVAQARGMDQPYSADELTASDPNLRQLRRDNPQLFEQILAAINRDASARNSGSPEELAAASPALDDLNRSSPEALLGLFLVLKGAAKGENQVPR
jgi:hypothetical protein